MSAGQSGACACWCCTDAGDRVKCAGHAAVRPSAGLSDAFDYRNVDLCAHAITFLDSLLDVLHLETRSLVCNSLGGLWSFWFALDRPQRVMSDGADRMPRAVPG